MIIKALEDRPQLYYSNISPLVWVLSVAAAGSWRAANEMILIILQIATADLLTLS